MQAAGLGRCLHNTAPLRRPQPASQQQQAVRSSSSAQRRRAAVITNATLKALIFDCDGVIVETEELHRLAYNAAFQRYDVQCGASGVVNWDESFYDILQNTVGGGKPKMRWFFGREGWPTSSVLDGREPAGEDEQAKLVDALQDYKTEKYMEMLGSGEVEPRPGVLELMDEARAAGLHVAVCSAATKPSCIFTLKSLLGEQRFSSLDCFLAGDDVKNKKPDPTIYQVAAEKLGVSPEECLVIEDSTVGLRAALGAGMRCIITYTPSTKSQGFPGAEMVLAELGDPRVFKLADVMTRAAEPVDDRLAGAAAAGI